jgi:hypothetical protein
MQVKPGKKTRVIFDASTKSYLHKVVLNEIKATEFEANIDFGQAKIKLLTRIYNWKVANPKCKIYLALADITACFQFPRIHADMTGAFGFVADNLYFLATSMVFGSNTSASSWEPFRRTIENLIPVYSMREDLVIKHKNLLNMLTWEVVGSVDGVDLVQAIQCPLNPGITALDKPLEAYIYVDDILASAVGKKNILRLLAAIIKAIFTVCYRSNIEIRQCPLSLKKWEEIITGTVQTILGLTIDINKLTVGITWEYQKQASWRIFKAANIQKLVGKIARLSEGALWIYKLMSHIYTSLAFTLKQNNALLLACSPKF